MKIIFIGGASASGKTVLARRLQNKLRALGHQALNISMDDYFHEIPANYHQHVNEEDHHAIPEGYPRPEDPNATVINHFRMNTNFYQTTMYDFELLEQDIHKLERGETIEKPIFDFCTNLRLSYETLPPPDYLIIEGLFAINFASRISEIFDKISVFVSTNSYVELRKRRISRDEVTRSLSAKQVMAHENKFGGPSFFGAAILRPLPGVDMPLGENSIARSKLNADIEISNDETIRYPDDQHHNIEHKHPLDAGIEVILETLTKRNEHDLHHGI